MANNKAVSPTGWDQGKSTEFCFKPWPSKCCQEAAQARSEGRMPPPGICLRRKTPFHGHGRVQNLTSIQPSAISRFCVKSDDQSTCFPLRPVCLLSLCQKNYFETTTWKAGLFQVPQATQNILRGTGVSCQPSPSSSPLPLLTIWGHFSFCGAFMAPSPQRFQSWPVATAKKYADLMELDRSSLFSKTTVGLEDFLLP